MKKNSSNCPCGCILVLGYLLYESLMGPIRFNKEAKFRKFVVGPIKRYSYAASSLQSGIWRFFQEIWIH